MDGEEVQPRVDSAYLAKNFLSNLQGPKEDFLMDNREISPQQIASLSQGADGSARHVPVQRPAAETDSEDESSWLVSPTSTPNTRGSTPYATPGKDHAASSSAWEASSSPAAKRARQSPSSRYADGQQAGSQISSSSQIPGPGSAGQGLSRIPRPRAAEASSPTASTASRRTGPEDLSQPPSPSHPISRIPQPRRPGQASAKQAPASSSNLAQPQPPPAAYAGHSGHGAALGDRNPPSTSSSGRGPAPGPPGVTEANGLFSSTRAAGSGRGGPRVPDIHNSPVAAYIYGAPARTLSDTASEADTQPDAQAKDSKRPPWRLGKAAPYTYQPDLASLAPPAPGTVGHKSLTDAEQLHGAEAAPSIPEEYGSTPLPEAAHASTSAGMLPEATGRLGTADAHEQDSHHLLLPNKQAEAHAPDRLLPSAEEAPHRSVPAASSLPGAQGSGAAQEQSARDEPSTAELLNKYAPPAPVATSSQLPSAQEESKAKPDQGLLVVPPAPVAPKAPAPETPAAQIPPSPFVASQEEPLESPFVSSSKSLTTSKSELDPSRMPLQSAVERSKNSLGTSGSGRGGRADQASKQADKAKSKGCCGCVVM